MALLGIVAVRSATAQGVVSAVDGNGDTVRLTHPATRVVSLVPDATELLIDLGAISQCVGRTQFDVEPEVAAIPSVGGMLTPDLERVRTLNPDLVIIGTGEKRAATRAALRQLGLVVYAAPIRDTSAFFQSTRALGTLLGRDSAATTTMARVRDTFSSVRAAWVGRSGLKVAFVMMGNPPTTTGPGTYVAELIRVAGGRNVFDDATIDWPKVSVEAIVGRAPDVVLVAERENGGQAAQALRNAPGWRSLEAAHRGRIVAVPADLIERPGPRMAELARIFQYAFDRARWRGSALVR